MARLSATKAPRSHATLRAASTPAPRTFMIRPQAAVPTRFAALIRATPPCQCAGTDDADLCGDGGKVFQIDQQRVGRDLVAGCEAVHLPLVAPVAASYTVIDTRSVECTYAVRRNDARARSHQVAAREDRRKAGLAEALADQVAPEPVDIPSQRLARFLIAAGIHIRQAEEEVGHHLQR